MSRVIKAEYVQDKARPGRPVIIGSEKEAAILAEGLLPYKYHALLVLLTISVQKNRNGREMPAACLGFKQRVSATSVLRILKNNRFHSVKPTRKTGLTQAMKDARLEFCLLYEHWTLEDWKRVIWTDETSVVLCKRGATRIWRRPEEKYEKTCIRLRWKGYSEFMFWGCFSYDYKGPCHIWKDALAPEKEAAKKRLEIMNQELEPIKRAEWEAEQVRKAAERTRKYGTRKAGGTKAAWKWDKAHGKIIRAGKGGIDWYRYQEHILKKKLIPFAKACQLGRPDTLVMEDGAASHVSKHQEPVWLDVNVLRMIWCGNSPDLNQIEPCWWWMKKKTTRKGNIHSSVRCSNDRADCYRASEV